MERSQWKKKITKKRTKKKKTLGELIKTFTIHSESIIPFN